MKMAGPVVKTGPAVCILNRDFERALFLFQLKYGIA